MSKQINDKMHILKKVFFILLILDFIELISVSIALFPNFKQSAGYGQIMMIVMGVITSVMVASLVFEILAKIFLIRSTSPTFSWSSGRKGYVTAAKFLLLFNFGSVILSVLSIGGEGATLINQGRVYLQILTSVAEMIAVFFYLRTVKKFFIVKKEAVKKLP